MATDFSAAQELAGFVVYDDVAIWGHGLTSDEAWTSFRARMAADGIELVDQAPAGFAVDWALLSTFSVAPATAGLLFDVEKYGGEHVIWKLAEGVACKP